MSYPNLKEDQSLDDKIKSLETRCAQLTERMSAKDQELKEVDQNLRTLGYSHEIQLDCLQEQIDLLRETLKTKVAYLESLLAP